MDITKKERKEKKLKLYKGFYDFMSDENIQLPLLIDENYYYTLEHLFEYYCSHLEFLSVKQQASIQKICNLILKIVEMDNDEAKEAFDRLMELKIIKNNLHFIEKELPIDGYGKKYANLFRLREVKENRKYKRKDIFHEPKIDVTDKNRGNYRYNLEERPSLYLSSTTYCCFKELGFDTNEQRVIGSLFRLDPNSSQELYILDLAVRPIDYVKNKNTNKNYKEYEYIFVYPLIAACSVVVCDSSARNIKEYKISNLLYRWLNKNYEDKLCGIRYFSCYDDVYKMINKDNQVMSEKSGKNSFTKFFINYSFPIGYDLDENGFSNKLKDAFFVSQPKYYRQFENIIDFEKNIKYSKSLGKL